MPDYDEFTVKNMYEKLKDDKYIAMYIPEYPKGQLPEKEFLLNIVLSIYPQQMYELVKNSQKKREVTENEDRFNKIELTAEIAKEIEDVIELPSKINLLIVSLAKPGRTLHLLKIKSKFAKTRKKPKKFSTDFQQIIDSEPTCNWKEDLIEDKNQARRASISRTNDRQMITIEEEFKETGGR